MKQLSGLDASFLYMETAATFGHVNSLAIYERPNDDYDPYAAAYERFRAVVGHIEPMRRRLVEVPFRLDHPYWIDDPDFDLDFHVRHIGLAPPGAADQLGEQVSRIVGRPMDRTHPLWEVYVIEGLADGRWALLTKTHHSTIDGAAGVLLLNMMLDKEPDADPLELIDWTGEQVPSDRELLRLTARHLVENPVKGMRLQLRLVRDIAENAGIKSVSDLVTQARNTLKTLGGGSPSREGTAESRVSLPVSAAPPTPFNKSITAHRRFAMRGASMANIKRLKDATGGTVNDIVMAICAGALREYLLKHDALPDKPLRAMVPVSIRTGDETDPWTNRVSAIVADLPTNCDDPLERVRLCQVAMQAAKRQFDLVPAESLVDAIDLSSPVVATAALRLVSRLGIADRVNLPFNLTISNVPGPREPLYFAGAKLNSFIPVSIVTDGMGLNITVHSYLDRLEFGLIAARDLVPDVWDLADMCIDEIARLFDATGAEWAEPQPPPSMRRGNAYVAPVARRGADPAAKAPKKTSAKTGNKTSAKKTSAKKTSAKKTSAKKTSAAKTAAKSAPKKTSVTS